MKKNSSNLGSGLLVFAIVGMLTVATMIFGARFGLWEPIIGFGYFRKYASLIGYAVTGLGAAGLIYLLAKGNKPQATKAGIATLLGLVLLAPMISEIINPKPKVPPIHDITTDTKNPPQFLVLDETRAGAKNTLVYGGPEIAAQQAKAYPDIAPMISRQSASATFNQALGAAKEMGWEIVAQDPDNYRFEASARTPFFSFVDDVVVVVTAQDSSSRIDIRSVSRVGRSDQGVNAARIREFVESFQH